MSTLLHKILSYPLQVGDNQRKTAQTQLEEMMQADVNQTAWGNMTPLFWAVSQGKEDEVIESLLEEGANINAPSLNGLTPIQIAVMQKSSLVAKLVEADAHLNKVDTKIEMGNALHWAVLSNNNEAIALFLGRNDAIDKMVKMELDDIIENIATDFTKVKHTLRDLALIVGRHCDDEIIKKIDFVMRSIVQRRRVVATQLRDHRQEETPVPERLTRESLKEITKASDEILKKLRNISGALDFKAKLDCHGMRGMTPLHLAVSMGNKEAIEMLIKTGTDLNSRDNDRYTPLHTAILKGDQNVLNMLIENKVDVEVRGKFYITAMHIACLKGNLDALTALVEAGARIDSRHKKHTPLGLLSSPASIITDQTIAMAKLLIENGANIARNRSKMQAFWADNEEITNLLKEDEEVPVPDKEE